MGAQSDPEHRGVGPVLQRPHDRRIRERDLESKTLFRRMNWHTLASTLLGALITFSAILFTQALEITKRRRTHQKLIHALLQALYEEVDSLLELARNNAPPIEADADGKPYEGLFTAHQDY